MGSVHGVVAREGGVLEYRQVDPVGPPAAGTVVVETAAVGLCGSDLELLSGHLASWMPVSYPVILGHEWSGTVREVGSGVSRLAPGDEVIGCGALRSGDWFGLTADGAARTRFPILEELVFKKPSYLPLEASALVEPYVCAFRGACEVGRIAPGENVTVIGAGMIGQLLVMLAVALGASVMVVEPSEFRRAQAAARGASVLAPEQAMWDRDSPRADLAFDASGRSEGVGLALRSLRPGGRAVLMGLCPEEDFSAPFGLVQRGDLTVHGSTGAPLELWPRALRFLEAVQLPLGDLVTGQYPFAEAAVGIDAMRDLRQSLKILLTP